MTPSQNIYRLGGGGGTLTVTGSNLLTGANTLEVSGTGSQVVLATANNYLNGTILASGTLVLGNVGALGTGTTSTLTVSAVDVSNLDASVAGLTVPNAITLFGDVGFVGTNGLTLSGNILLEAQLAEIPIAFTRTITVSANTLTLSGIISGAGVALQKAGPGILDLTGANTFNAGTTVIGGTLLIGNASNALLALGPVTVNGFSTVTNSVVGSSLSQTIFTPAELALGNNGLTLGTVNLLGGTISGTGGTITGSNFFLVQNGTISANLAGVLPVLIKSNTGTVTLSGTNTYQGGTTVAFGTLFFASTSAAPNIPSSLTINAGAEAAFNAPLSQAIINLVSGSSVGFLALGANTATNLVFTNAGAVSLGATGNFSYGTGTTSPTVTISPANAIYDLGADTGTLSLLDRNSLTGGNGVLISGSGSTVVFSQGDNYTGGTVINSGTLILAQPNALVASAPVTVTGALNILNNAEAVGLVTLAGNTTTVTNASTTTGSVVVTVPNAEGLAVGQTVSDNGIIQPGTTILALGTGTLAGTVTLSLPALNTLTSSALNTGTTLVFTNGNLAGTGTLSSAGLILQSGTASAVLAGNVAAIKNTTGEVYLMGNNTFTGGLGLQVGTLALGNNGALGTGALTVLGFGATAIDAVVPGLVVGGTVTLFGDLTFVGTDSLSLGNLVLAGPNQLRTITVSTNAPVGTSSLSTSTLTVSAVSGAGFALNKQGNGTLALNAASTYNLGTTINSGTILVAGNNFFNSTAPFVVNSGTLDMGATATQSVGVFQLGASATQSGTVTGSGVLLSPTFNLENGIVNATLGGPGAIIKTTGNTVAFTVPATNTGGITLSAGNVQLQGPNLFPATGAVTLSGASLNLFAFNDAIGALDVASGTITGSVSTAVTLGSTLTANSITMQGGTIAVNLAGSTGLLMNPAGNATATLSAQVIPGLLGGNSYTGGTTINSGTLVFTTSNSVPATGLILINAAGVASANFTLDQATFLSHVSTLSSGVVALATNSSGIFSQFGIFSAGNPTGTTSTGTLTFSSFPNLSFGASGNSTYSGTITTSNPNYLLGGGGASLTISTALTGTQGIVIVGPGSTILTGNDTYTGATVLNSGNLIIGSAAALSANLIVNGGNLDSQLATSVVSGTLTLANAFTYLGTNNLTISGTIAPLTANELISVNNNSLTMSGLSGSGFSVIKLGGGTLDLGGTNTYSGGTFINTGTLGLVAANALLGSGLVDISGGALNIGTVGQVVGPVQVVANGQIAGSGTLSASSITIQSGTLAASLVGAGGVTKVEGFSTATISGPANTYTGSTTVNAGTLVFTTASAIPPVAGAIAIAAPGVVVVNVPLTQAIVNDLNPASTGFIALGASTVNSLSFGSAVSLGSAGTFSYSAGTITPFGNTYRLGGGGGTLQLTGPNLLTGSSSLVVSGSTSTVLFQGSNSFTGSITVNSGTLQLGTPTATLATAQTITGSNTLTVANAGMYVGEKVQGGNIPGATVTITGLLSTTAVTMSSTATVSSTATLTGTGTTAFDTVSFPGAGFAPGSISLIGTGLINGRLIVVPTATVASAATFNLNGGILDLTAPLTATTTTSLNNPIAIGSGFFFTGNFPLILAGTEAALTQTATITTSANTGTLSNALTLSGALSGGFGLVKTGPGVLTLNGNNTYSGTTTVDQGTLITGSLSAKTIILGGGTFDLLQPAVATTTTLTSVTYNAASVIAQTKGTAGTDTLSLPALPARLNGTTQTFLDEGVTLTLTGSAQTTNMPIVLASQAAGFIGPGTFFDTSTNTLSAVTSDFAFYSTSGFLRAPDYGVDALGTGGADVNFESSAGGTTLLATSTNSTTSTNSPAVNLRLITNNVSAQPTSTFASLNMVTGLTITQSGGSFLDLTNGGFLKSGGGTGTITGGNLTTLTNTNSGELVITVDQPGDALNVNSNIVGGLNGVTKGGLGTVTLNSGSNFFTGGVTVAGGTLVLGTANTMVGNVLNFAPGSGATVNFGAIFPLVSGINGDGFATLTTTSTTGGYNVITQGGVTTVFSGNFNSGGSSNQMNVFGTGTQSFNGVTSGGANQQLNVSSGNVKIDFSTATLASNIFNSVANSTTLSLVGGNLFIQGKTGTANSQTFPSYALANLNGGQSGGASTLVVNAGGSGGTLVVNLSTLNANNARPDGATLDITLPTGAQSATNGVIFSTPNLNSTTLGGANTIVGGWLTVNGGSTWGVSAGTGVNVTGNGNITPFASFTTSFAAAGDVDAQIGTSTVSGLTINSLRLNNPGAYTVSGTLTIASGGILVTSNVGANAVAFSGGNLISLNAIANPDIILIQDNTSGGVTIADTITNSSLTGSTSFTKSGAGSLTLSGNNTYTGQTFLIGGTTSISSNANLGAQNFGAGLTLNNATLAIQNTAALNNGAIGTNDRTVTLSGNGGTFQIGPGLTLTISGPVVSGTNGVINTSALTLTGGGELALLNGDSYSGITTISQGILNIQNGGALGSTGTNNQVGGGTFVANGATLQLQQNSTSGANVGVGTEGLTIVGGGAAGATGALENVIGNNTFGGLILLNGAAGSTTTFASDAGVLTLTNTISGPFGLPNGANLALVGNGNMAISGIINTGSGSVTVAGNGTVTLSGANTFTGSATVNSGTLALGSGTTLEVTTTLSGVGTVTGAPVVVSGATAVFDVNSQNATVSSLNLINGLVNGTTGTLASATTFTVQSGIVNAVLTGTNIGVNKIGAGTVTFSSLGNTYTGTTSISSGTLALAGASNNNIANSPVIALASGANLAVGSLVNGTLILNNNQNLSGSGNVVGGIVAGPINSNLGSAIIAPGTATTTGALTFNALSLNNNTTLNFAITSTNASNFSSLSISGLNALTLTGATFNLFNLGSGVGSPFLGTGTFNLVNYNGTTLGGAADAVLATLTASSVLDAKNGRAYVFTDTNSSIVLNISLLVGNPFNWNVNGNGTWTTSANWQNVNSVTYGFPGGSGVATAVDTANFAGALTSGSATVTLNASQTLTDIEFTNSLSYTITGSGTSLTMNGQGSSASINDNLGQHFINVPLVLASNLAVGVANPSDVLSLNGVISGNANLALSGSGKLILGGANTYVGNTSITSGTLQLGNGGTTGSLGVGPVNSSTGSGTLAFDETSTVTVGNPITGTLAVQQSGPGGLAVLTGSNSFNNGVVINTGTLRMTNTFSFGVTTNSIMLNGGTFDQAANIGAGAAIVLGNPVIATGTTSTLSMFNTTSNLTLNSGLSTQVTLTGSTTTTGSTTLTVRNTVGLYPGNVVTGSGIPAGTVVTGIASPTSLTISQPATVGSSSNTIVVSAGANTITLTNSTVTTGNAILTLATTSAVFVGDSVSGTGIPAGATVSGLINATSVTLSSVATATANGTDSVTIVNPPSAVLNLLIPGTVSQALILNSDLGTFSGTINLGPSTGALQFSSGGTSTVTNAANIIMNLGSGSATLDNRNGTTITFGALSGGPLTTLAGATVGGGLTIYNLGGGLGAGSSTFTMAGSINNGVGGGLTALIKSGTSSLVLTGSNSYTGTTSVQNGTLTITGSTALVGTPNTASAGVSQNGAALLGGILPMEVGNIAGQSATLNLGGNEQTAFSFFTVAGNSANSAAGNGTVNLSGGQVVTLGFFRVGDGFAGNLVPVTGIMNMTGGSVQLEGDNSTGPAGYDFEVGSNANGIGVLNMTGGEIDLDNAMNLLLTSGSAGVGTSGTVTQSGGTIAMWSAAPRTTGFKFSIQGNGFLTGALLLNSFSGTGTLAAAVTTASYTLAGNGVLALAAIEHPGTNVNDVAVFNFNGGTIIDMVNAPTQVPVAAINFISNLTQANIMGSVTTSGGVLQTLSNGAVINMFGANLSIPQNFANGNALVVTSSTSTGSTVLTFSGTQGTTALGVTGTLAVGQFITGANIPPGTTITGITVNGTTVSTTLTLSQPETGAGTSTFSALLGDGGIIFFGTNTFSANPTGTAPVTVTTSNPGLSTVTLSGTSTFTGGITMDTGTLAINQDANLGATGTSSLTLNNDAIFAPFEPTTASQTLSLSHPVVLGLSATSSTTAILLTPGFTLTFGATASISGPGQLNLIGGGTLVLTATNSTYTGSTNIQSGTLAVSSFANGGSPSAIGAASSASSTITIATGTVLQYIGAGSTSDRLFSFGDNGTTIDFDGSGALNLTNRGGIGILTSDNTPHTITFGGAFVGTATQANVFGAAIFDDSQPTSIIKVGVGSLTLNGSESYSGPTSVNSGTLVIGSSGVIGFSLLTNRSASPITVASNLVVNGNVSNNVATPASLTILPGAFLSGTGSIAEPIILNPNGTIFSSSSVSGLAISNTITMGTASTLSNSGLITGAITDNGGLITGNGTISSAINLISGSISNQTGTLSGTITVNPGALVNAGTGRISGTVNVVGGTLTGTGTVAGPVVMSSNALLDPGFGTAPGTLTLSGGLTLSNSSNVDIFFTTGTASTNSQIFTTTLTLASKVNLVLLGTGTSLPLLTAGSFTLSSHSGTLSSTTLSDFVIQDPVSILSYTLTDSGGFLKLTTASITSSNDWIGASNNYNVGANFRGGSVPNGAGTRVAMLDTATTGPAAVTVTLNVPVTLGELDFSSINNFTIASLTVGDTLTLNSGTTANQAILNVDLGTQAIAANLVLTATNAGGLSIANINGTALTVSGVISGSGAINQSNLGILAFTGANTFTGGFTLSGGFLIANTLANGGAASSLGASSSVASSLVLEAGSTLQFVGTTTASTDRLFTVGTNGATLDFSGSAPASFANTGLLTMNSANATNFILTGTNSGNNAFNPTITDNANATQISLVKNGVGSVTLGKNNQYSGATIINGGVLIAPTMANGATSIGGISVTTSGGVTLTSSEHNTIGAGASGFGINSNLSTLFPLVNEGASVTGTGIRPGTVISFYDGQGTITLSQTTTGSVTTLVIGPSPTIAMDSTFSGQLSIGEVISGPNIPVNSVVTGTNSDNNSSDANGNPPINVLLSQNVTGSGNPTVLAGFANSLGLATNNGANFLINGGALEYTGTGATSDHLFTIGTNSATINFSGTPTLATLTGSSTVQGSTAVTVSSVAGLFVSQAASGVGILPGTVIAGIGTNTVTLSQGAGSTATTETLAGSNTTTGSSTVTVSNTSLLSAGEAVTGTGIPAGATISAIVSGTQLTLSTTASATGTVALSFIDTAIFSTSGSLTLTNPGLVLLDGTGAHSLTLTGTSSGEIDGLIADGSVSGLTSVTMSAAGTVTLGGQNTFTGGLTVTSGTLAATQTTSAGLGAFNLSGGTLALTATSSGSLTYSNPINVTAPSGLAVPGSAGTITLTGTITTTNTPTLTFNIPNGTILALTQPLNTATGSGAFTGTLGLGISTGELLLLPSSIPANLGSAGSVTFDLGTFSTVSVSNLNAGGTITLGALFGGGNSVLTTGSGAATIYVLGNGANSVSNFGGAIKDGIISGTQSQPISILLPAGLVSLTNSSTVTGSAVVTVSSTAALAVGNPVTGTGIPAGATVSAIANATSFTLSAPATATATATDSLSVTTSSTVTLSGANTYTGTTSLQAGVLNVIGNQATLAAGGNPIEVGTGTGQTATLNIGGGQTGPTITTSHLIIGGNGQATATTGTSGSGVVNMSSGTLFDTAFLTVGSSAVSNSTPITGTLNFTGGSINLSGTGSAFEVGDFTNSTGIVTMSGTVQGTTLNLFNSQPIRLSGSNGATSSSTLAEFTQNGGTINFYSSNSSSNTLGGTGGMFIGVNNTNVNNSLTTYVYNLNGGTIFTPFIGSQSDSAVTKVLSLNGGTIVAVTNTTQSSGLALIGGNTANANLSSAFVHAGGAIISVGQLTGGLSSATTVTQGAVLQPLVQFASTLTNASTVTGSTNLTVANTIFLAVGDSVAGLGLPAGTTVSSVLSGTQVVISNAANLTATSETLTNASTTTGSATVTVASTAGLAVGEVVTGTNIPANSTISAVVSGTQLTLSTTASGNSTGTASLAFSVSDAASSSTGGLTKLGNGTLTLAAANTYGGTTTVSTGTLGLTGSGTLGTAASSVSVSPGATLALGTVALTKTNSTVTVVDGTLTASTGTLNLPGGGVVITGTASSTVAATITGTTSVTQTGADFLTVMAPQTYTGTTTISGGTMDLATVTVGASNFFGSLGSTAVTVNSGATLAGTGTVSGSVTLNSGAILSPGDGPQTVSTSNLTGTAGTLHIGGTLNLTGPTSITLNIIGNPLNPNVLTIANAGTSWDSVSAASITGLSPANKITLNLANLTTATGSDTTVFSQGQFGSTWAGIITSGTSLVSTFAQGDFTINTSNFLGGTVPASVFTLSLEPNGTAIDLTFTIPEPATVALFAGLAALGLAWIRRRRLALKAATRA